MAKNLIIVEPHAKPRTISNFVGKEFKVVASMGHIRDLPSKELRFDPEEDFAPNYEVPAKKKKVIKSFGEIEVINGRYGPYIKKGKDNYRIPKGTDLGALDQATCEAIMEEHGPTRKRGRRGASTKS
jgi:hypothetical protein